MSVERVTESPGETKEPAPEALVIESGKASVSFMSPRHKSLSKGILIPTL